MIFWVRWEIVENEAELLAFAERMRGEVGLELHGIVAEDVSGHPAIPFVQRAVRMGQTLLLQLSHDHSQPAHLYEIGDAAIEEVEMCLGSIAALHCLFGFSHSVYVFLAVP